MDSGSSRSTIKSKRWRVRSTLALAVVVTLATGCGTRLTRSSIAAVNGSTGSAGSGSALAAGASGSTGGASGSATGGSGGSSGDLSGGGTSGGSTPSGAVTGGSTGGSSTGGSSGSGAASTGGSATGAASTGGSTGTGGSSTGGSSTGGSSTGGSSTGGSSTGGSSSGGGSSTGGSSTGGSGGGAVGTASILNNPIFGGNAPCTPATGSPIQIGNVSTLSGVLGELFHPVVPALQTFVKAQNNCGGLNGHPINLTVEDDQDDPSTAASDGQDEIQNHHILAFVGNIQVLTIDNMVSLVNSTHVPIIGGDITNNTWFSSSYIFPEGPPPEAISFGYLQSMTQIYHDKVVGDAYCLEVPQACEQIDAGFKALAGQFGATDAASIQISIVSPSYTSQCLTFQNKKVQALALTVDAATQSRFASSCASVGYHPQYIAYPLGVGNQSQFFGNANLGNTYVPLNTFPWMDNATPVERYYQASVAKYNPGFVTGDAASLGWTSGALMVAASTDLTSNPTSAQFLNALYQFKGQSFTTLGGMTAPLTFNQGGLPTVPYCLFAAVSNSSNTAWNTAKSVDHAVCTSVTAPNSPK